MRLATLEIGGYGKGCGIAFELSDAPGFAYIHKPTGTTWEVEIAPEMQYVVARTVEYLDRSEVSAQGLESIQQCLDLLAYEKRVFLRLKSPGEDHTLVFRRGDLLVAQYVAACSIGVDMQLTAVHKDRFGNEIPPPTLPPPVWTPGLRFYRMSQTSSDLYEAYRCLWLGFELLLHSIAPKVSDEREREWLLRALSEVGKAVDLKRYVPPDIRCPPAYIVGTQYDHIRCRLFHSKTSTSFKDLDFPEPEEVSRAYRDLIRIWRDVAERCLGVRSGGGSAMTYAGFRLMMDNALSNQLRMYFSNDDAPVTKDDTVVSPNGMNVIEFHDVKYKSEVQPGRVAFVGTYPLPNRNDELGIYRICSKAGDALITACYVNGGMIISNVDYFESYQEIRLQNKEQPKTDF